MVNKETVDKLIDEIKYEDYYPERLEGVAYWLFRKLFNKYPKNISRIPVYKDNNSIEYKNPYSKSNSCSDETFIKIHEKFGGYLYYIGTPVLILDNQILYSFYGSFRQLYVDEFINYSEYFVRFYEAVKKEVFYAYTCGERFFTSQLEIKDFQMDIKLNYNDDIPYDKIINLLNSDDSELILFNSEPGTGKTFLLRHLIQTINKKFIYSNSSFFNSFNESALLTFLQDNKNSIFILEDCECLLSKVEDRGASISTLLNMCDGLIGDSFKIKFICTYNIEDDKIDKLCAEKVVKLGKKLGFDIPAKSMFLCDVYNYNNDIGDIKKINKIGF